MFDEYCNVVAACSEYGIVVLIIVLSRKEPRLRKVGLKKDNCVETSMHGVYPK